MDDNAKRLVISFRKSFLQQLEIGGLANLLA